MLKRTISVFLILATVVSLNLSLSAFSLEADDTTITPYYVNTDMINSRISISSKTASCASTVIGISGITTKITITQYLQKKNGTSWTNVASWTKTVSQVSATFANSKSSLASGTYRTRTVAKVYRGSSYETVSANSTSATC